MSTFNLIEFTSKVINAGLASPNRFEVQIVPPTSLSGYYDQGRTISLFCEISNLPGMSITTKGHRIYGAAYQRPVSAEFGGEAITMTFYVDREMDVKAFFDAWLFKIVNPYSFNVAYQEDYVSQIKITQLDQSDKETYSVYLEDAFPRAITMMDLNMSATNQAHKLSVTFAYRRWIPEHTSYENNTAALKFAPNLKNPMAPKG